MKQGWEIKKLGEVFTLKAGKSISSDNIKPDGGEKMYPCFGGNGIRGYVDTYIAEGAYPIIGRVGALCGNIQLSQGKFYATEHAIVAYIKSNDIKAEWAALALKSLNLRQYAKGVAQPVISAGQLAELSIPIPPREEQERIVEELDCLSGVIEKKREQLRELDALAQSIFYQMFGDPITNKKGWEVKKLGEVASEIFAGGDKPKDFSDIQTDEYLYPIYANGEGDRGLLGYSKTYRVESKAVALGARGASIGNCRICEGKFTPVVRLITIIPSNKIDIIYLFYSVRTMSFNISGAGQAQLTTPNVINKSITIPPLSLQQEFAEKIEAIEKQKELIKQSITQTEELFNARMDYYFN